MKKTFTLAELADALSAATQGDANKTLTGIASLEVASGAELSFLSSAKFEKYLDSCAAGAVILKPDVAERYQGNALVVDDPYLAYAKASALFNPRPKREVGVHPSAVVSESAQVASSASIGANCVIGDNVVIGDGSEVYPGVVVCEDSSIGDNALIYPNVTIYSNVRIGNNVIIHSGTNIGSDGFGFAPHQGEWVKIHQIGGVVIGDRVDIGAGCAIDRGAIGDTIIGNGVIIDNNVHMAHNVEVGDNTAIAGCVGIAGSTKIGKNCTFAGAVAVNGHIEIADNCHFNGGTIVTKGTDTPGVYASATPLLDVKTWRKSAVRFGQLDELSSRVRKLEKQQTEKK